MPTKTQERQGRVLQELTGRTQTLLDKMVRAQCRIAQQATYVALADLTTPEEIAQVAAETGDEGAYLEELGHKLIAEGGQLRRASVAIGRGSQ